MKIDFWYYPNNVLKISSKIYWKSTNKKQLKELPSKEQSLNLDDISEPKNSSKLFLIHRNRTIFEQTLSNYFALFSSNSHKPSGVFWLSEGNLFPYFNIWEKIFSIDIIEKKPRKKTYEFIELFFTYENFFFLNRF